MLGNSRSTEKRPRTCPIPKIFWNVTHQAVKKLSKPFRSLHEGKKSFAQWETFLPACFCTGCYLCLEPIFTVAKFCDVITCKPYGCGACVHYVMVSKIQWKPFWLATQLYPQNDWAGRQYRVNYDVFAWAPFDRMFFFWDFLMKTFWIYLSWIVFPLCFTHTVLFRHAPTFSLTHAIYLLIFGRRTFSTVIILQVVYYCRVNSLRNS